MVTENSSSQTNSNSRYWGDYADGEIIAAEGPGKGFASYPWVLDHYERALDLSPTESWLIHRMIKYVWKEGGYAFPSMRKVSEEAKISRTTLLKTLNSIIRKGYIQEVGRGNSIFDHRVRYDISGIFNALTFVITCNWESKWAEMRCKPQSIYDWLLDFPEDGYEHIATPVELNHYFNKRGEMFNWCSFEVEPLEKDDLMKKKFEIQCGLCMNKFLAYSTNAKYCHDCRISVSHERWEALIVAYENHEKNLSVVE